MPEKITIQCGERLSIEGVEALHAQLEDALQQGSDICLDGSLVQYADTAGLQLIAAFQRALDKTGHSACWAEPSDVLMQTAGYLGLTEIINLSNSTNTL